MTTLTRMAYPVAKRMTVQVKTTLWGDHRPDDLVEVGPGDMIPAEEVDAWFVHGPLHMLNSGFLGPQVPMGEGASQHTVSSVGTMANGGDSAGVAVAPGFPRHHGGPWYELSNGERVKGRTQALTMQAALDEPEFDEAA